jgi:hypothetical protein
LETKPFNLLIADDDQGDRMQISRCLQQSGLECQIQEADSVVSALDAIRRTSFDCVILDYNMLDQDGLEGVDALLKHDPCLAIIMSTAHGDENVASAAIKLGAMDYLAKADLKPLIVGVAVKNSVQRSRTARALEEQREALAVFAQVLVHDMKAPMQSILGFSRLVGVFLDNETIDREKIKGHALRIAEGAQRMNALLDRLHAYTSADAQPKFEDIAMDELLRDAESNLDAMLRGAKARLVFANLPTIFADRAQIAQLMQNLICNGIKYCKSVQPEVHIEAHSDERGDWIIEIRDNGIGIDEQYQKDIFEPFRRLHSQEEYEGTGLGLATCKKIVERHNGQIWCESRPGEGTSFFFSIPRARSNGLAVDSQTAFTGGHREAS